MNESALIASCQDLKPVSLVETERERFSHRTNILASRTDLFFFFFYFLQVVFKRNLFWRLGEYGRERWKWLLGIYYEVLQKTKGAMKKKTPEDFVLEFKSNVNYFENTCAIF